MSEQVLVTGGTGQVGRAVVQELLARGVSVAATTRDARHAASVLADVDLVELRFDDAGELTSRFPTTRRLFLCPPSVREVEKEAVSRSLIEAAAKAGCEQVSVLSGWSAFRDEASVSRRIERCVEASGLAWTHLRPNFFMQNYGSIYAQSISRGVIDIFSGDGRTSLIDARDIGAAAAATLCSEKHIGRAYMLTGSEALDDTAIAEILSRVLGKKVEYTATSHDDTRRMLAAAGIPEASIESSVQRYEEVAAGLFEAVHDDFRALVGREPISFEQYAIDHRHCWL